jgi:uncharacterized protein
MKEDLMIRWFCLFLFACAFSSQGTFAQDSAPVMTRPLIFSIEKEGRRAYIYGSGNILLEQLPSFVLDRFNSSQTLVVETNLEELGRLVDNEFPLPSPVYLWDLLTTEEWDQLVTTFQTHPLKGSEENPMYLQTGHLGILYPFAAAVLYRQILEPPLVSQQVADGFEVRAKNSGMSLEYLETGSENLEIYKKSFGLERLQSMLAVSPEVMTNYLQSVDLNYLTGDEDLIAITFVADPSLTAEIKNVFMTERNENWAQRIDTLVAKTGVEFIVVGAAHLGGENGVLEVLGQYGYQVTRITE